MISRLSYQIFILGGPSGISISVSNSPSLLSGGMPAHLTAGAHIVIPSRRSREDEAGVKRCVTSLAHPTVTRCVEDGSRYGRTRSMTSGRPKIWSSGIGLSAASQDRSSSSGRPGNWSTRGTGIWPDGPCQCAIPWRMIGSGVSRAGAGWWCCTGACNV